MLLSAKVIYTLCIVLVNIEWSSNTCLRMFKKDIYLATAQCETLLDIHESIMHALEMLVDDEEKGFEFIKRHLRRFEEEQQMAMTDAEYMRNPLNAFIIIKRLTKDLDQLKERILTQMVDTEDFINVINDKRLSLPSEVDLVGAALGVRRIQVIYKLDVEKLFEGKIEYDGVVTYSSPMSADDCFEMGRILFDDGDFSGAEPWLERAIWLNKQEGKETEHSNYETYLDNIRDELDSDPSAHEYEVYDQDEWVAEGALCRNEVQVPYNVTKGFTCYLSRSNPFLQLAPVKTEQLYTDPDVYMFYDVISDDEIEYLKELSEPRLKRAEEPEDKTDIKDMPGYRTCKHAWIKDEYSEVAARISQRVNDFTGWYMKSAEPLQIVNYGIGGHYDAHLDFATKYEHDADFNEQHSGNRIATVLFYMSDVTQGGATVFLDLGLSVFPVKNAALAWVNLYPSGEGDLNTLHAACPVLIGTKWTATKWLSHIGQEFIRPCNLEYQKEIDTRELPKPIRRVP